MDDLPETCEAHSLPMSSVCIDEECEISEKFLCDICMNSHNKEHKYIISLDSLKNHIYEKIIEKNEEQSRANEQEITNRIKNIETAIESEFLVFTEELIAAINSLKKELLDKIAEIEDNYLEDIKIWKKLKFQYEKSYISFALKNKENQITEPFDKINEEEEREVNEESYEKPKLDSDSLKSLFLVISQVLEKQIGTPKNGVISEMNFELKEKIGEDISKMKKDLKKLIDEKINFSSNLDGKQFSNNSNIPFQNRVRSSSLQNSSTNINNYIKSAGNITPSDKKKSSFFFPQLTKSYAHISPMLNNLKARNSSTLSDQQLGGNITQPHANFGSPENSDACENNRYNGGMNPISNYLSKTVSFTPAPESFNFKQKKDVFPEKKGEWYSLEYIEDHDFIVCGYQTGEILIFNESDQSLVRTYRPRFKRIRKIIYSPENSSIFASYDDGYIVAINLTNFKISSYKMCNNQIYSMDILPNLNAIIFGGVDKKILYSYIIDLNKVLLFYDSKEGDIQCLFYEEKRDILVAAMRKSTMLFFKFSSCEQLAKYEFIRDNDCCAMTIKKIKDDTILTSGYFLQIYEFKFIGNDKIDFIGHFQISNFNYIHVYDLLKLDNNILLVDTFDDGCIVFVDIQNKKAIRTFECCKGIIQMKMIKQNLYVTSYSGCLKKIPFN